MTIGYPTRPALTVSPRTLAISTAGFWGGFLALYTLRGALLGGADPTGAFWRRAVVVCVAIAVAWLMASALARLGRGRLWPTLVWTALLSAPAATLFAMSNFLVFDVLAPLDPGACGAKRACSVASLAPAVVDLAINRWFVFVAWGVLILLVRTHAQRRTAASAGASDASEGGEAGGDAIWAPMRGGSVRIPMATIRRVEAERDYVRIISDQGSYLLRAPMATMHTRLGPSGFVRVHRSTLLRIEDVVGLRRVDGAWMAIDRAGDLVRIGRRYLEEARRRLGALG